MRYKILNTVGPEFAEKAKAVTDVFGDSDYKLLSQTDLPDEIGKYHIAVIGIANKFDREVLARASDLKVIATPATGLDHIDLAYAKERGIEVLSLRGETEFLNSITGTAELAFGLLIDLLRLTPFSFDDVKRGCWDRGKWRGRNLSGMTLGVVGAGRLGRRVIRYGSAFGMKVIFYDPDVGQADGAKKVTFEELLSASDAVSIHVHLSPDTENLFDKKVFQKMKKTAVLVNTSRGKIVNEKDVLGALTSGAIGGYAADVLADELDFKNGLITNHPLVEYAKGHMNCIITPHIGGMTHESREATDVFIAEKLARYLKK